jgi:1-deoxy-D-xylulose-5-phosphate synthase
MNESSYPLLSQIKNPSDLRQLPKSDLLALVTELREFLIQTLNECGGHFAGNLGTVELAIALHAIFNTPEDRLIWDVGHQAYPHKILTGRADQLHTIRQTNGLAPFPKRSESEYDAFCVGHSSTSISAALGMAIAAQLQGSNRKAIAIIGDGAMTAGMAFEALNHAGAIKANLLVVLNDNDMSISENVGALSNYFANILSSKLYTGFRAGSKTILKRIPPIGEFIRRTEEHLKGMIAPGTLFEELGFNYLGPFDGHDLKSLLRVFENVRDLPGPQFIHVITKKGQGFPPAEADPIAYHAVKKGYLNPLSDTTDQSEMSTAVFHPTYSNIFGDWLCDMAEIEPQLVAITPAMREGSDLIRFSQSYPERYFDVGIAEQHSLTLAAGMACEGLKPVVAIYSTFLQRGYDQLIHDIALQNLPVLLAIDRSGLVGGDGSTHQGNYDLSYLRCIPNMTIMAPSNGRELRHMLYTGLQLNSPVAVRYPRGLTPDLGVDAEMVAIPLGKAEICHQGKAKIAILAFGAMLAPSLEASMALDATVVNMRFVKPLDETLIQKLAQENTLLVTVEENVIMGGAGSAVSEYLAKINVLIPILHLGLPDQLIEHGDSLEQLASLGLNGEGIAKSIQIALDS